MSDIVPHNPLEGDRGDLVVNLHDGSEEQISIIIVHKDCPEYLTLCIQSIIVCSFNNNYEIIIVDNASGPESQAYLTELERDNIKVIRNDKNLYWGPAATKGAAAASKHSKYLVFMHCDVVITNGSWLDLLVNVSESQGSGMVGLDLQSYYINQDGSKQKIDFIPEWCLMMTRECWKDIGPFPEKLPMIGIGFIMTRKAHQFDYKPQILKTPICHHYAIFSLNINEYERLSESATVAIPQIWRELQTKTI